VLDGDQLYAWQSDAGPVSVTVASAGPR
jgi:hypothetical protein